MPPPRATVQFGSLTSTLELFRADGLTLNSNSDSVTANIPSQVTGPENIGNGLIDISGIGSGLLVISVGGIGGAPSLAMWFDIQDAYGHWVHAPGAGTNGILASAITAAGTYVAALSTSTLAAFTGRLSWTVTGTTPSLTGVSLNVYGR